MEFTIETKEQFVVMGLKVRTKQSETKQNIPQLWDKMMHNFEKTKNRIPGYGICYDCTEKCEEFTYMAAMPFEEASINGFEQLTIPKATYVVSKFTGKADTITKSYETVIKELKENEKKLDLSKSTIEYYPPEFKNQDDSKYEIWVAIEE